MRSQVIFVSSLAVASTLFVGNATAEPDALERPALSSARAASSVLLAVTRADKRLVAVGERGVILLSDADGSSWHQAKVPVSVTLTNVYFPSATKGWAVGHSGVVLHTEDGGATWTRQLDGAKAAQLVLEDVKAANLPDEKARQHAQGEAERLVADGPDKPFLDVYFFDDNNGLIVGAYGLIFATQDGGKSWRSLQQRLDNPKGKHLYAIRAAGDEVLVSGEQGALFRSVDGGKTFAELKTPYPGTFFGVVSGPKGEIIAFGLRGNVYWSGDHGLTWQKVETGKPNTITAGLRMANGSLLLVDESGRVLQSGDAGRSFLPIQVPEPSPFTGVAEASDGSLILSGVRGITRVRAQDSASKTKQ